MFWLLPAIGAAAGALTQLNHPDRMLKNAGIGGLLGLGASAAGATPAVSNLLGLGGTTTAPLTGATGQLTMPQLGSNLLSNPSNAPTFGLGYGGGSPFGSTLTNAPSLGSQIAKMATNPFMNNVYMGQGSNLLFGQREQPQQPMPMLGGSAPQTMARVPLPIMTNPQLQNIRYPNGFRLNIGRT